MRKTYIIARPTCAGFCSDWTYVIGNALYARSRGYSFVIDMKNYPSLYREDNTLEIEGIATDNVWEYYFEQPNGVLLDEVYKKNDYLLSSNDLHWEKLGIIEKPGKYYVLPFFAKGISKFIKKNIPIKSYILEYVDNFWTENVHCDCQTIGVHIRGTDKKSGVGAVGHIKSSELSDYIVQIDKLLKKNIKKKKRIFVATDEAKIIEELTDRYGSMIFCADCYRASEGMQTGIHFSQDGRKNHKYNMGLEVIIDAVLLSKCDYLIHSHSNVINIAYLLNGGKYKKTCLVDSKEVWC